MMQHPPQKSRVKIEDIAKATGVSIMSVSRAMRGVEGISLKKRDEILKVAKQMGYSPNSVAGSLAAANSTLIGISVPTLFDEVFAEIFNGMRSIFNNAGFQTIIDTTEYNEHNEKNWIDRMLSWRPAGIVLSGINHDDETIEKLQKSRMPIMEMWDYTAEPIDMCVGLDHVAAGAKMGAYLVSLGYQRPAYVGAKLGRDARAEKRLLGLQKAFGAAGIEVNPIVRVDHHPTFESGRNGFEEILKHSAPLPDVVCFLNDHTAFGGISACEFFNIKVPQDMGIVGFNGLNINKVLPCPITTCITPREEMGQLVGQMLLARIKGAHNKSHQSLPVELYVGKTTRDQLI